MPSEKRLSLNNKGAIVALRGEGHSLRVIGRKLEIAHSTVCKFLRRYDRTGSFDAGKTSAPQDAKLEKL